MSVCKYCQKQITWMKEGRKNVPVESDGTTHKCQEMISARDSLKSMGRQTLSPEEIAKYEKAINEKAKKK